MTGGIEGRWFYLWASQAIDILKRDRIRSGVMAAMNTYLFSWVPTRYPKLYQHYEEWLAGNLTPIAWSSGNTTSIPSGSRIFLMRQGAEPKGIIAAGYTVSPWRWSISDQMNANDVLFDSMAHPDFPRIPLDKLLEIENKTFGLWLSASSGISIGDDTAESLELAWGQAVAEAGLVSEERIDPVDTEDLPGEAEGRGKFVTHLIRERKPSLVHRKKAQVLSRTRKLQCEGCETVLADVYGPLAANFIECHHVNWLSHTGETITNLDDLALLCPNCHRIIHRGRLGSVADLCQLIRVHRKNNP